MVIEKETYSKIISSCEIKGQTKVIVNSLRYLSLGYPILLYGPPGTGKTTIAKHILTFLDGPDNFYTIEATEGMTEYHTIGGFHPLSLSSSAKEAIYKDGIVTRAIKNNKNLIIDEFNRAPSSAYSGLFMLLSMGMFPLEHEQIVLKKPKNFKLIVTANINDEGTFKLSSALKRRFIPIKVDYPTKTIEEMVIKDRTPLRNEIVIKAILEFASKTRILNLEEKVIPQGLSTDGVIKMAKYCKLSMDENTTAKTAFLDSAFSQSLIIADESDETSIAIIREAAIEIAKKIN